MATSIEDAIAELAGNKKELITDVQEIEQNDNGKEIMKRVLKENDIDRMETAAHLLNTFNFAIQVQAGRQHWTTADYKAFAIALCSLDSIGTV